MALKILGFGKIAEIAGSSFTADEVPDTDTLKLQLEERFPALREISYLIAVDKKVASSSMPVGPDSVIALLPPFSGG